MTIHIPRGASPIGADVARAFFHALCLVRHPRSDWTGLLHDPARLRYGVIAVVAVAGGYTRTVARIARSGGTPGIPWPAIPRDPYFAGADVVHQGAGSTREEFSQGRPAYAPAGLPCHLLQPGRVG